MSCRTPRTRRSTPATPSTSRCSMHATTTPRILLPTVDSLNSVTADDIDRVVPDRFGDASDWIFAFSGDLDLDEVDRTGSPLPRHPARERAGRAVDVRRAAASGRGGRRRRPPAASGCRRTCRCCSPPPRVDRPSSTTWRQCVVQEVITAPVDRHDPRGARRVVLAVRGGRGRLGGPTPNAEIYISTSTGAELVDEVEAAVLGELDDLRANGPTRDRVRRRRTRRCASNSI